MSTNDEHLVVQAAAAFVTQDAAERGRAVVEALGRQDQAFEKALGALQEARAFIGSPEHILGNAQTKHGEIAEHVEVAVRNARDFVTQRIPIATFDGIGRLDAADYRIGGEIVQSKFINGVSRTLDHVRGHMDQYPGWGQPGSFYHIPRDYYDVVKQVSDGHSVQGLSDHTVRTIATKVRDIERLTGRPFEEVVKPGVSKYADVLQGRVHETLDDHEGEVRRLDGTQRVRAHAEGTATISDVANVAARGALVGAGVRIAGCLYAKCKAGDGSLSGLTASDWQDIGLEGLCGAAQGGIAAGAIFVLTECADLAAPFAGAIVSSATAVGSLVNSYRLGEISFEQLIALGEVACAEAAMVGMASALGQALIPLPVIGAMIGAVAGRILANHARSWLDADDRRLAAALAVRFTRAVDALGSAERRVMQALLAQLDRLGELTEAAFDMKRNVTLRLPASVALAHAHGVPDERLIRDAAGLDRFILG